MFPIHLRCEKTDDTSNEFGSCNFYTYMHWAVESLQPFKLEEKGTRSLRLCCIFRHLHIIALDSSAVRTCSCHHIYTSYGTLTAIDTYPLSHCGCVHHIAISHVDTSQDFALHEKGSPPAPFAPTAFSKSCKNSHLVFCPTPFSCQSFSDSGKRLMSGSGSTTCSSCAVSNNTLS